MSKEEFLEKMELGLLEEHQIVSFILHTLIHEEQVVILFSNHLDVHDLLNGRWPMNLTPTVEGIFNDWNLQLGKVIFKT